MVFSERVRNYGSRGKGVSARDNHIIKGMKALHLLAALAWAGGAFSMQALGFLKLGMDDPATVKLVEYCRYIVDSWVVMPGLIGCVLTGLFYSIFTSLGFFKFAWVTIKWIISFAPVSGAPSSGCPWVTAASSGSRPWGWTGPCASCAPVSCRKNSGPAWSR